MTFNSFRSKKYKPLENNKIFEEAQRNKVCTSSSKQKVKNEYYNYSQEHNSKRPQNLKVNTLLRNYSENSLYKDQKARNYLNIVKMCNRGEYPQTARNNPHTPYLIDSLNINTSSNAILSPSKGHMNDYSEREKSRNSVVSTSNSCSNIFKQRRSTQNGQDCQTARNRPYKQPGLGGYSYHN